MFINYTRYSREAQYHGKAISLNADDRHAPFPAIFLIHELRVRGFCSFAQEPDDIPTTIQFQDWMAIDGSVTSATGGTSDTPSQKSSDYPGHPYFLSGIGVLEGLRTRRDNLGRHC